MSAPAVPPFADTNVLLYLIAHDADKASRAEKLLSDGVCISVQVLNEFAAVARREPSLQWHELIETLAGIRHFATLHPLSLDTHLQGLALAERYGFSVCDAMIAAAALQAGCGTLLSEDFQPGQLIDGRLKVVNPFAH